MEYRISDNFSRSSFACKCGKCRDEFKMSLTVIGILEHLKVKFNKPVKIFRAYICDEESKVQFGNNKDYHHLGKAVDFYIEGVELKDIFKEVEGMPDITGIGFSPQDNHIHIDIRDKDREIWLEERREKIPLTNEKRIQYNLN